jgi:SAM-dependent methyltransferase
LNLATDVIREGAGNVYRCEACDFEMLDGPTVNYDGEYRQTHGPILGQATSPEDLFNAYKDHQDQRINMLEPWMHGRARVLEVGCSAGMFLDKAKQYARDVVGVDADTAAIEYAAKRTGCKTYPSLEAMPLGLFDVVCMFQTLEHIADPLLYLAEVKRYLARDGLLVVEVPSLSDPLLTLYDCPEYRRFFYHGAHRWYFSPDSLVALMDQAGFAGHLEYVQNYNFLNALSWCLTGKPQPNCKDGLAPARLPTRPKTMVSGELALWAEKVDAEYKRILAQFAYTENITFLGRLK